MATTFHLFESLPCELQHKIWSLVISDRLPSELLSSHWNYTDYRGVRVSTLTHPGYMSGSIYLIYSFHGCPLTRVCHLARFLCLKEWFKLVEYEGPEPDLQDKLDKEQRVSKIMEGLVEEARRRLELGAVEDVGASEAGMKFL